MLHKIGYAVSQPVVSVMPTGAQMDPSGRVHLAMMGGYVVVPAVGVPWCGDSVKLVKALSDGPKEPTYSGSGNTWAKLTVEPDPDGGQGFGVYAGEGEGRALVFRGRVDPDAILIAAGNEQGPIPPEQIN